MSSRKSKKNGTLALNYGPVSSNQSRLPSFKPPSFYAAAAGLKYSPNVDSHARPSELSSTAHDVIDLTVAPLSYPTGDGEQQDTGARRNRSNSFSRPFSRTLPKQQRQDSSSATQSRRKSQMAEIPFLETQLLPSLRDTIDRMTHPPRSGETEDATLKPHTDAPSHKDSRNYTSRPLDSHGGHRGPASLPSSPYTAPTGSSLRQNHRSPHTNSPQTHGILKSPHSGSSSHYNSTVGDAQGPSRVSSRLPTGIRNASALRANMSPASVPIPPSPLPGQSPVHTYNTPRPDIVPVSLQPGRSPVCKSVIRFILLVLMAYG